jgi:hypothetical protein
MLTISCYATAFCQKYYVTVDGKSFADKKGVMTVSRADMLEKGKVTVVPDIGKVTSFYMSYLPVRGEYSSPTLSKNGELTKEQKFWVQQSHYGDKFFLEDITVKLNNTGEIEHAYSFIVQIQ